MLAVQDRIAPTCFALLPKVIYLIKRMSEEPAQRGEATGSIVLVKK